MKKANHPAWLDMLMNIESPNDESETPSWKLQDDKTKVLDKIDTLLKELLDIL